MILIEVLALLAVGILIMGGIIWAPVIALALRFAYNMANEQIQNAKRIITGDKNGNQ